MFNWYRNSAICYAYLEDIESGHPEGPAVYPEGLKDCRWWTRGWTLQELIAPSIVIFFARDWITIGTRYGMKDLISLITGISADFFDTGELGMFSIAQRMYWASRRQTTRIEDQAYCLLGLFGVTMPLVYGEGTRAFVRLQEEIIKESDDQSIFAWAPEYEGAYDQKEVERANGGLLASSPSMFANSNNIVRCITDDDSSPYTITNKGIQISLPIIQPWTNSDIASSMNRVLVSVEEDALVVLNCQWAHDRESRIAILLVRRKADSLYIRVSPDLELVSIHQSKIGSRAMRKQLFVKTHNMRVHDRLWSVARHETVINIDLPRSLGTLLQFGGIVPSYRHRVEGLHRFTLFIPAKSVRVSDETTLLFRLPNGPAFLLVLVIPIKGVYADTLSHVYITPNTKPFTIADRLKRPVDVTGLTPKTECYLESPNGLIGLRVMKQQRVKLETFAVSSTIDRILKQRRLYPDILQTPEPRSLRDLFHFLKNRSLNSPQTTLHIPGTS